MVPVVSQLTPRAPGVVHASRVKLDNISYASAPDVLGHLYQTDGPVALIVLREAMTCLITQVSQDHRRKVEYFLSGVAWRYFPRDKQTLGEHSVHTRPKAC